ncbi:flagellar hook protein FlgE [Desulfofundulus australicus DSM 11792]|uniref:Flagellar hook protein FlgE n=1 Tax=Desulfofundulus australicus DSM 11792 TaxID=1121425 RepID=A0A1M4VKL4_9FIRM|nr:flagellar hook-basal body complex protein [Desulfofundulus australicus]SHE69420.1 flagellar hook protein FlgE [Desulfofundulus australicus DSM 11792]
MIRSLFAGVAGMKNHQIRMDVIGNNISNVNTVGFKSQRANFQDMVYQMIKSPSAPTGGTSGAGSINPSQVGTGVIVAGIGTNMGQGALQGTGRTLDLAIQGNGFFQVTDTSGKSVYTRNGIFYIDQNGFMVDSNGNLLVGIGNYDATPPTWIDPGSIQFVDSKENAAVVGSISIGKDGKITAYDTAGNQLKIKIGSNTPTNAYVALFTFPNPEGLKKVGQNYFDVTDASGSANLLDNTKMSSEINSGYLEMSNVDLTDEFTNMITTQRGYQASARIITVSDTMLEELINLKR